MGVIYLNIRIWRFQDMPVHYNVTYELIMAILHFVISSSSFISLNSYISCATSLNCFNFWVLWAYYSLQRTQIIQFWDHPIQIYHCQKKTWSIMRVKKLDCANENWCKIAADYLCQSCVRTSLLKCLVGVSPHMWHKKWLTNEFATDEATPRTSCVARFVLVAATCVSYVNTRI